MKIIKWLLITGIILGTLNAPAYGFSSNGHEMVGAIADKLLVGSKAEKKVQGILGKVNGEYLTLQQVAVWPDCVRGINPGHDYAYEPGKYKVEACAIFEDKAGIRDMADYAKRNNSNCNYSGKAYECHKAFHFADVDIEHDDYHDGYVGTSSHDVVHAISAAILVLKGDKAPAPFNIKDKREALMLLTHFIGDVHQPLHVGAVYLDESGKEVNPEHGYNPNSDTHGGNSLFGIGGNLHHQWDYTQYNLSLNEPANCRGKNATTIKCMAMKASKVKATPGTLATWPAIWASQAVVAAKKAMEGIRYKAENKQKHTWQIKFDDRRTYLRKLHSMQKAQVVKAGARLAQLLKAIWPD